MSEDKFLHELPDRGSPAADDLVYLNAPSIPDEEANDFSFPWEQLRLQVLAGHTHPLSEIDQSGAQQDQFICWDNGQWVPKYVGDVAVEDHTIGSHVDASFGTLADQTMIRWDQGTLRWVDYDHLGDPDPHPQYLTPGELPSFATTYLTNNPHPDDGTKLLNSFSQTGEPESSIVTRANTENVPDLIGEWMREVPFPENVEFSETETRLTVELEKDNDRACGFYYETYWLQGGVGGTEVLVATSNEALVEQGRHTYTVISPIQGPFTLLAGDTVVTKLYVIKRQGGQDPNVTLYMEGNHISRYVTFVPITVFQDRVRWVHPYVAGPTYYVNDMVLDDGWTMIANKETTDRAAPQPIGDPVSEFDQVDPGFVTQTQLSVGQWTVGHRYTASDDVQGWAKQIWVFSDQASPDVSYEVWVTIDPLGSPRTSLIGIFAPNAIGWFPVSLSEGVISPGTQFDIFAVIRNTGVGSSTFSGTWTYKRGNSDPGDGEIYHRNDQREVRISLTDKDDADREAELDTLKAGDTMAFGGITWTITEIVAKTGTYLAVDVTPQTRANEAEGTVLFEVFAPATIPYPRLDGYYAGGTVQGFEGETPGGVTLNTNAYGIDVVFQPAGISEDWDLVSTLGSTGGSGGGGLTAHSLAFHDDVDDSARVDQGVLQYDNAGGQWTARTKLAMPQDLVNPTIIPDEQNPTYGIGHNGSTAMTFYGGGSIMGRVQSDGIFGQFSNGWGLRHVAAGATGGNATLIPNRSAPTVGISGYDDGSQVNVRVGSSANQAAVRIYYHSAPNRTSISLPTANGSGGGPNDPTTVANQVQLYAKGGQLWAMNGSGLTEQITSF